MTRRIVCRKCGDGWKLHPEDRRRGIKARRVAITTKTPQGHGITIFAGDNPPLKEKFSTLRCDSCNGEIQDGSTAWAITTWSTERESEPRQWESEYSQ